MALPISRAIKNNVLLSFGTFSFPVNVHGSVAEDTDGVLKTVCVGAGRPHLATGSGKSHTAAAAHAISTVHQTLTCPICSATSQFGKGSPVGDGLIPIDPAVLEAAEAAEQAFASVLNVSVHDAAEVAAAIIPSGKLYYLNAKANVDIYTTFVELITSRPDRAFVTRWSMRTAASPFRLIVDNGLLVLQQLASPDLMRERPVVNGTVNPTYLEIAGKLIDELYEPFDVSAYDRPKAKIIADFLEGKMPQTPLTLVTGTTAVPMDLMDALKTAVTARKAAEKKTKAKPAAKTPTKTAPAKKTATSRRRSA